MRGVFVVIALFVSSLANAQLVDSIRNSFQHKPKPLLALTTRNAFITNQLVKVRGVKAGVSFNNTTKVGLTYNWLRDDINSSFDTSKFVKMNYVAPFIEYVFYSDHRFSFTIPVRLGVGKSFYQYENKDRVAKNWIMVYEPGMQGEMRFLRYFGVSAGIGLRAMLLNNKELQERFNSPIYMLGFKIYFDTLKKDFIK
jgi:hypothetical protein